MVITNLRENSQEIPTVEDIQDRVESMLMKCDYVKTAKAYILYRKQHQQARHTKNTLLDYKKLVDGYIGKDKDWRVKENSTVTLSVGALILSNSGAITANYWLSEIYDEDIAEAHRKCFIHLHDLSMLTGYCAGWSLKQLIQEGLGGVPDRISSAPAKHLSTLCNQMVNFLGIMQNEWAGAQAFSSFDTYLAPFVKADNLDYKEVKQCIQSFIYGVNTPSRWGTQAPFTNITLDWTVPDDMKDMPAIVGGKNMDFTYNDCKKEMEMVNKAFIETMIEGDANGRGFQYPIPTYSITKEFDWSATENNRLLFEMTAKYGTPYFSNYINSAQHVLPSASGPAGTAQEIRRLLRLRRKHRLHRRGNPKPAPHRVPEPNEGRVLCYPGQIYGHRGPFPVGKTESNQPPHGRRPVSLHPPLPGHL